MKKACVLYREAFPANERMPFFMIKKFAKKVKCDLFGIYDNGFSGIMFVVYYADIVYIFYLAVIPEMRGKGCGTKALSAAKEIFADKRIILNMEEVDEKYSNFEQRLNRQRFYESNGFSVSDYKTSEKGVVYEMLYCSGEVSFEEYSSLIQNLFGKLIFHTFYKRINK